MLGLTPSIAPCTSSGRGPPSGIRSGESYQTVQRTLARRWVRQGCRAAFAPCVNFLAGITALHGLALPRRAFGDRSAQVSRSVGPCHSVLNTPAIQGRPLRYASQSLVLACPVRVSSQATASSPKSGADQGSPSESREVQAQVARESPPTGQLRLRQCHRQRNHPDQHS